MGRPPGSRNRSTIERERANAGETGGAGNDSVEFGAAADFVPDGDGGATGEPGTGAGSGGNGGGNQRAGKSRGRPRAQKKASLDVNGIEKVLLSIHFMGASALSAPELAINSDEAKGLATAIANVAQHYPMTVVDEKTMAWINLAMCAGMMYGPRFMLMRARIQQEANEKAKAEAASPTFGIQPFSVAR